MEAEELPRRCDPKNPVEVGVVGNGLLASLLDAALVAEADVRPPDECGDDDLRCVFLDSCLADMVSRSGSMSRSSSAWRKALRTAVTG